MTLFFKPSDDKARSTIKESLDKTLFVEASAGTGKTTSLVARVTNLVSQGMAKVEGIAAITFTEAAAAELRDRIRTELEEASEDPGRSPEERELCRQGISNLDEAAIQTLHSFAMLLLRERPLEAGLPPAFEVSDEVQADVRFNEEWDKWLDDALETEPLAGNVSRALSLRLSVDQLKSVAREFHQNYDNLANVHFEAAPPASRAMADLISALPQLESLCVLSSIGEGDTLYDHVQGKLATIRRLQDVEPGSNLSYRLLQKILNQKGKGGNQKDWGRDPETGENGCKALKALLDDLQASVESEVKAAKTAALMSILQSLRDFAIQYSQKRRTEGRAEFHDLLIWARDLLRDNIGVRDHFRRKFTHLLVDEVQDTDPLQAEIAMFLSEDATNGEGPSSRPNSWLEVTPKVGKLFVVGDPKQSIYRFRRADVEQMERLREKIAQSGGRALSLVQNFRSHRPLVDWVNALFSEWMQGGEYQAKYEKMRHRWDSDASGPFNPKVWALSDIEEDGKIGEVRKLEARDIAALIHQMVSQEWPVRDKDTGDSQAYRPVTYSDVCILMPTRTGLRSLEQGLEEKDIPYRLENASLIFETQEVRDLLNCLKAIDDPSNNVAVVGALRSPAFACSDVDLVLHSESGGAFDYTSDSTQVSGPVGDSLAVLREFHEQRIWTSPAALIDRFIRKRSLMEAALDHPRTREQWRRYRFIVEQAWRFSESGGDSLRPFVQWIQDRVKDNVRVTEAPVPDSDEEAVRVMTIHAAKGLEFPVVILTGINSPPRNLPDKVIFDRNGDRVEVGLGAKEGRVSTPGYEELVKKEKNMTEAERVRHMYVAATRACDHLVLSLRRNSGNKSFAAWISAEMRDSTHWEPITLADTKKLEAPGPRPTPERSSKIDHSPEARELWHSQREALIQEMSKPTLVTATSLGRSAPQSEDKPEQESDEPWRKGRGGTSVGRAVHAVLQSVDLSTGADVEARAKAQAVAERVPGRASDIARLVRTALDSEVVRRAVRSRRLWREVPVAASTGHGTLHGFIDLLFEEDDGLVIVDYKTDSVTPAETAQSVERYRLQGGAYAYALQRTTGKRIKDVVFLYLQPKKEEPIRDLNLAMREAEASAGAILDPIS